MLVSPLEQFQVTSLISLQAPLFSAVHLSLTNLGLYTLITVGVVMGYHHFAFNDGLLVPNKWSLSLEAAFASLHGLVKAQIGVAQGHFLPLIYGLFFYLLVGNLNGNVPYGFTFTTSAIVALGLSFTVFLGVTLLALHKHGLAFFSFFVPSGAPAALIPMLVPIEAISYMARAVSLGVRLFANMVSGHSLLKILAGFLSPLFTKGVLYIVVAAVPFAIFIGIVALEIAVSFIQAYVFCILTASYIKDAVYLH